MTALLACQLPERIAAFAAVSGSYFQVAGCHPARAVPLLEIHGTADRTVPYGGSAGRRIPPVATWLAQWAARDGCVPRSKVFLRTYTVVGEQRQSCRSGVALMHYQLIGGKHAWPSALPAHAGGIRLGTATLIWAFCQAHPLP